jgi:hypothetical protein
MLFKLLLAAVRECTISAGQFGAMPPMLTGGELVAKQKMLTGRQKELRTG